MAVNNFDVGRDITLTVVTDSGPLNLTLITDFQSKQETTKRKIKGIDGRTRNVLFQDGYSGSFMVERQSSAVDDYFAQTELDSYNGVQHGPISITSTIQNPNGDITQYKYINCVLTFPDAGSWKGDDTVKMRIDFDAEQRLKTA